MNDTGAMIIIGIFGLGGLILIVIFKKLQDTYGAKKAIQYSLGTFIVIGVLIFIASQIKTGTEKTDNVDDYILKNKFEEALHLAPHYHYPNKTTLKVLKAQLTYWLSTKELDRALLTINEMKRIPTDVYNFDLPEVTLNIAVYESSLDLTRAYCEQGQKEKAEQFAKSLINSFKEYLEKKRILSKAQYNEIKNSLPVNEIIEPYHTIIAERRTDGVDEEYHIVYRLYSPKADALIILKDCK